MTQYHSYGEIHQFPVSGEKMVERQYKELTKWKVQKGQIFTSLTPIVPKWDALPEFRFKNKNGSLEKKSYESCVYQSVGYISNIYWENNLGIKEIRSYDKKKIHAFVFGGT